MEAARSQMHFRKVPAELWGESVMCATYVLNRSASSTHDTTPYEAWYGRKPNLSHLRVFGSQAFVHIPDAIRHKLEAKAAECIMVGYSEKSKAYRTWNPITRRVITSCDVIFNEEQPNDQTDPNCKESYSFDFPLTTVQQVP